MAVNQLPSSTGSIPGCTPQKIPHRSASTEHLNEGEKWLREYWAIASQLPLEGKRTKEQEMTFNLLTTFPMVGPSRLFMKILIRHMEKTVCKETTLGLISGADPRSPEYNLDDLYMEWVSNPEKLKIIIGEVTNVVGKLPDLPDVPDILEFDGRVRRIVEDRVLQQLGIDIAD